MDDADRAELATSWRRLVERAIGASVSTLIGRSAEGLRIAPLHDRRRDDPDQPWRSERTWSIVQRIDHPDAESANGLVRLDLDGGADALVLVGAASPFAHGYGVADTADLDLVFEAVELDTLALRLDAGPDTPRLLARLADLTAARRLTSAAVKVDIGFDPIGWTARLGIDMATVTAEVLETRTRAGFAGTAFLADGRPWHEAGAGEAQELAAVLATAVAYLRAQEAIGISLDAGRQNIGLMLAADADLFLGLAKFRAVRRLWARIEGACGLDPAPVRLHAETSWRTMTRRDPWTNVMRATAGTFAAGLGGADTLTVLPFTLPLGLPDPAARRLARNVQLVLRDEAHLAKVADPAAGAGGFETLTETLCEKAWMLFQEIEREGGIARSLATGGIKARIAATACERADALAKGEGGIIGTSRFVSPDVPPIAILDVPPRPTPPPNPDALPALRDAAPFEPDDDARHGAEAGRSRQSIAPPIQ